MALIRKEQGEHGKHLRVGPFRLRYRTEISYEERRILIGPLRIRYRLDEDGLAVFRLLGVIPVGIRVHEPTRKVAHYRMRDRLTTERCRELLMEEIPAFLGDTPDLEHPITYNEKILWMKLYEHNPLIRICCDKYAVKEYVANTIGPDLVVPVLGAWDDPAQIDFDALPEQFVLKVNWSSGYNIIVRNKAELDREAVRTQLRHWMKPFKNSYYEAFNWGYKDMKPVVYAEQYIEQVDGQVYDYKFCFSNGKHLYTLIATDRKGGLTKDFFDEEFRHLPVHSGGSPHARPVPEKPRHYDRMLEIAAELAKPFLFVRVDFYEVGDRIYVGEMTFYPGGGKLPLDPPEWEHIWGDRICLPDTPHVYHD